MCAFMTFEVWQGRHKLSGYTVHMRFPICESLQINFVNNIDFVCSWSVQTFSNWIKISWTVDVETRRKEKNISEMSVKCFCWNWTGTTPVVHERITANNRRNTTVRCFYCNNNRNNKDNSSSNRRRQLPQQPVEFIFNSTVTQWLFYYWTTSAITTREFTDAEWILADRQLVTSSSNSPSSVWTFNLFF